MQAQPPKEESVKRSSVYLVKNGLLVLRVVDVTVHEEGEAPSHDSLKLRLLRLKLLEVLWPSVLFYPQRAINVRGRAPRGSRRTGR